jgi:uncharacterized protein involved in response to NO
VAKGAGVIGSSTWNPRRLDAGLMRTPLLSYGFRPFFLAAALWAAADVALWIIVLTSGVALPARFDPLAWHIHEMLFGFVMAAMGGFLLTAIPNWTSRPPVAGAPLACLATLWIAGRIACLVGAYLPAALATALDLSFPVALIAVAARELAAAGNRRNLFLLAPISVFAIGNLLMHLQAAGVAVPAGLGWRLGLVCALVLISVIAGRIVPAFTRNWLDARGAERRPATPGKLNRLALASLHTGLFGWALFPGETRLGWLLLAAAALNYWRLAGWRGAATFSEPLLAVLHLGYFWLASGAALLGLSLLGADVPEVAAVHALSAGAIGTMILAVMTRATLGHTGRPLHATPATIVIYLLITGAALLRVIAAWPISAANMLLMISAACWIGAFALFASVYGSMLLRPRAG